MTVRSSALTPIFFSSRENAGTLLMPLLMRFKPRVEYKMISGLSNEKYICLQLSEHVGKQSCQIFSRVRCCVVPSGSYDKQTDTMSHGQHKSRGA